MAISYVGGKTVVIPGTTSTTVVDLTDIAGGSGGDPLENDIVIVAYVIASTTDLDVAVTTSGYTEITELYSNDTRDTNLAVFWKRMGSTPDTDVTLGQTTNVNFGGAAAIQVYRGVDLTTALDVTSTTATGIDTDQANPASITPSTSGAWVVAIGGGASTTGAIFTSSDLSDFLTATSADNNDATIGMGHIGPWTSGAVDAAIFGGGENDVLDSWAAITLALRPASAAGIVGAGAGTFDITGSATGSLTIRGAGAGTLDITGTAAGRLTIRGAGSGTLDITGTATGAQGSVPNTGAGSGVFDITGSATGSLVNRGNGAGVFDITGAATGSLVNRGNGSGTIEVTGSATGTSGVAPITGDGAGVFTITGSATGTLTNRGVGEGVLTIGGAGAGTLTIRAAGAGLFLIGGTATGLNGAVDADEQYPLAGLTLSYPLEGQSQTYPLMGLAA